MPVTATDQSDLSKREPKARSEPIVETASFVEEYNCCFHCGRKHLQLTVVINQMSLSHVCWVIHLNGVCTETFYDECEILNCFKVEDYVQSYNDLYCKLINKHSTDIWCALSLSINMSFRQAFLRLLFSDWSTQLAINTPWTIIAPVSCPCEGLGLQGYKALVSELPIPLKRGMSS